MFSAAQAPPQEQLQPYEERSPPSERPVRPWVSYAVVIAVVLVAFSAEHILRPVPVFPYDDSYIVLHSAQVLHSGADPNYPGTPALFGITSAPFLAFVYLLLFALAPLQALNVACWTGLLLYALGLLRLTRVLNLRPRQQWLLVFAGLVTAPIPIHWLSGLETSCALAAVVWTLSFATGARRGWTTAAFLAGVATAFRPDLVLFALLLTAYLAWELHRSRGLSIHPSLSTLKLAGATALPILLCAFWYYHQTGSPIPLTGVAKRYFFAQDHWPLARRTSEEGVQTALLTVALGPLLLVLPRMARTGMGRVLLGVWLLFIAALFVQFPGEFGVNEFRYPVVLIPTLIWGLGITLRNAPPTERSSAERLLYICCAYAVLMLPVCFLYYRGEMRFFNTGPRAAAVWCQRNLPSGTPILIHDAGYLAYSTSFQTVDIVGLKTPWTIPINRRYIWRDHPARGQALARIALQSGSRYLILNTHWPPVISLPHDLRVLGWKTTLLDHPGAYDIFRISPPSSQ